MKERFTPSWATMEHIRELAETLAKSDYAPIADKAKDMLDELNEPKGTNKHMMLALADILYGRADSDKFDGWHDVNRLRNSIRAFYFGITNTAGEAFLTICR